MGNTRVDSQKVVILPGNILNRLTDIMYNISTYAHHINLTLGVKHKASYCQGSVQLSILNISI